MIVNELDSRFVSALRVDPKSGIYIVLAGRSAFQSEG
jgi:hypothetical protein